MVRLNIPENKVFIIEYVFKKHVFDFMDSRMDIKSRNNLKTSVITHK